MASDPIRGVERVKLFVGVDAPKFFDFVSAVIVKGLAATVIVNVVVVVLYKESLEGVKVAVKVAVPTPTTVTVLPKTEATAVFDEAYETDPAMVEPETVAVGVLIENVESP
jgi:hypothetical protein